MTERPPQINLSRATLSRAEMLRHMLAANAAYDGQFVTGVTSTGIYCLPSCRARKPKPEHVVFYASPAGAQAAGLRACRRCKPDDFYAGAHTQEQLFWGALGQLELGAVPNVAALAGALGYGHSQLHKLFREHLQVTPALWLSRQRVQAAQELLLKTDQTAAQVAFAVGFGSLSAFGQQFRRYSSLSPQAFRELSSGTFTLSLPRDYHTSATLADLGRDHRQSTARVDGPVYRSILRLPEGLCALQVTFRGQSVRAETGTKLNAADALALHQTLLRLLGLHMEPSRFEAQMLAHPQWAALIRPNLGLRVPLYADPFDGLVWAILGQQISFKATCTLRRRLLEQLGQPLTWGLYAPPTAPAVAALSAEAWQQMGLTRQRAELLARVAGLISSGELDLVALGQMSAAKAAQTLQTIAGIGPWTAQYMLLRVYGFQDALPAADSALQSELQHVLGLEQRPNAQQTERLMAPFAPYRSLATFHLWRRFARRHAQTSLLEE